MDSKMATGSVTVGAFAAPRHGGPRQDGAEGVALTIGVGRSHLAVGYMTA